MILAVRVVTLLVVVITTNIVIRIRITSMIMSLVLATVEIKKKETKNNKDNCNTDCYFSSCVELFPFRAEPPTRNCWLNHATAVPSNKAQLNKVCNRLSDAVLRKNGSVISHQPVSIYIYIYTHSHAGVHTFMRICTYYAYVCAHTCILTYLYMYVHIYIHVSVNLRICLPCHYELGMSNSPPRCDKC